VRQVFHIDVDVPGLIGLEGAVLRPRCLGLEIAQVADAMPTQAAVEARARSVWIQELAHHRQKIVQRHQQRPAQRHGDGFLRGRQRCLKAVRRVAAILNAVALAPFIDRLLRDAEALCQQRRRLRTRLDRSPDLRRPLSADCYAIACRAVVRRLFVKMDQHGRTPSRLAGKQSTGLFSAPPHSLRTDLAMKRADRRGLM
jgi:hypothetical protein